MPCTSSSGSRFSGSNTCAIARLTPRSSSTSAAPCLPIPATGWHREINAPRSIHATCVTFESTVGLLCIASPRMSDTPQALQGTSLLETGRWGRSDHQVPSTRCPALREFSLIFKAHPLPFRASQTRKWGTTGYLSTYQRLESLCSLPAFSAPSRTRSQSTGRPPENARRTNESISRSSSSEGDHLAHNATHLHQGLAR
jgi:hypothetical protein